MGAGLFAGDFLRALALLTRSPLRADFEHRTAEAVWCYPLVGALVGGVGTGVGLFALGLGLSAGPAAGLALVAMVVFTGALHEDGLADSADGLWGGWTVERRLEIMRDSLIGAYGVIALVLSLLLRWSLLSLLLTTQPWAIVAAAMASRGAMPPLMALLPHARADGLSKTTGKPPAGYAWAALGIGAIAAVAVTPLAVLGLLGAALACGALAKAKLQGQTGDVLGATQQVAEIAVLLCCAAALAP